MIGKHENMLGFNGWPSKNSHFHHPKMFLFCDIYFLWIKERNKGLPISYSDTQPVYKISGHPGILTPKIVGGQPGNPPDCHVLQQVCTSRAQNRRLDHVKLKIASVISILQWYKSTHRDYFLSILFKIAPVT